MQTAISRATTYHSRTQSSTDATATYDSLMLRMGTIGESDCEALRDGLLAQPVLALTSFAYVIAAIVVWRRLPEQDRSLGYAYAVFLAFVGFGSVLFHGPQTPGSKFLHDAPIPALGALIVAVLFVRWRRAQPLFPGATSNKMLLLLAVIVLALLSFAAGRTASPLCEPDSLLQLHGLWHILSATGFAILAAILFDQTGRKS